MKGSRIVSHQAIDVNKIKKEDCLGWFNNKTKQWEFVWDKQ
jgi:hypothetical protein